MSLQAIQEQPGESQDSLLRHVKLQAKSRQFDDEAA